LSKSPREFTDITSVAVVGAGLIGCSWAALFAGSGRPVRVFDTRPDAARALDEFWAAVAPALVDLGLARPGQTPQFQVTRDLAEAVAGADFIQECIPERLDEKLRLYREIEPHMAPGAILATSSSGLKLTDLQAGLADPGGLIIAHPFNPPHLVPLVELYGNDRTAAGVLDRASRFYESCGKVTIRLKREVLAHVANRLQAALWREAIHLAATGVASLKDIDTAIWAGPGLRWSIMGPHLLLNLGGGEGGLARLLRAVPRQLPHLVGRPGPAQAGRGDHRHPGRRPARRDRRPRLCRPAARTRREADRRPARPE
jgi:carnitine 3-dehydrogenase